MRRASGSATRVSRTACWCRRRARFEQALTLQPELVIFGSGPRLRFVSASLLRGLIDRRIGVETMDTAAACRTYNVLAGEGRAVLAALLLDPFGTAAT
jgi:uncharacterized protein